MAKPKIGNGQSAMCLQAICEATRPGVPLCAMATSAQQLTMAQGLESPPYSAMHQLWVGSLKLLQSKTTPSMDKSCWSDECQQP